jgi:hypothetical protein
MSDDIRVGSLMLNNGRYARVTKVDGELIDGVILSDREVKRELAEIAFREKLEYLCGVSPPNLRKVVIIEEEPTTKEAADLSAWFTNRRQFTPIR